MNKNYVSLEVAKKLQEAGYKSECESKWWWPGTRAEPIWFLTNKSHKTTTYWTSIPAPSAVQLAEEMKETGFEIMSTYDGYRTYSELVAADQFFAWDKRIADSLGLMMVYLLEQGLIK